MGPENPEPYIDENETVLTKEDEEWIKIKILEIFNSIKSQVFLAECIDKIPGNINAGALEQTLAQFLQRNGYLNLQYIYPPADIIRYFKAAILRIPLPENNPVAVMIICEAILFSLLINNRLDPQKISEKLLYYIRIFKTWRKEHLHV